MRAVGSVFVVAIVFGGLMACGTVLDLHDDTPSAMDGGLDGEATADGQADGGDTSEGGTPDSTTDARGDASRGKMVFVTTSLHDGNLFGLAGGDAICNAEAKSSGLTGNFLAFLQTGQGGSGNPVLRMRDSGAGWSRADGVVAFKTAPPTAPSASLDVTSDAGLIDASDRVWTGFTATAPTNICAGADVWQVANAENASAGNPSATNGQWKEAAESLHLCNERLHLYCFEQ